MDTKTGLRGVTKDQMTQLYLVEHLTMKEIGGIYGVTRAAVSSAIRSLEIDTTLGEAWYVACSDPSCGKPLRVTRGKWRQQREHYCDMACFENHRNTELPEAVHRRQATRVGRAVIEAHIRRPLTDTEVVHHIDADTANNSLGNLMVFISQGELLRYKAR